MRRYTKFISVLSFLFCSSAVAQTDLIGTWQGNLSARPNESYTIQLIITKQANGSYSAWLHSPYYYNQASAIRYAGSKLTIEVASLAGSYSGAVNKVSITGEWRQQNSVLPLVLTLQKPDVGTLKPLMGEWVGTAWLAGSVKRIIAFRFGTTGDGRFAAFMDFPETPLIGKPVIDVTLTRDKVSWKAPDIGMDFSGQLSGNCIKGKDHGKLEVNLVKGKYQPGIFNMPAEDMQRLVGQWVGKWDLPGETVYTMVLRFEKTKEGKLYASFNIPLQVQQFPLALADLSLKGDQLSFWIPKMWNGDNTEYTGKLNKDSISGAFSFRGKQYAVNLTRGVQIEAPVTQVDMPDKKMEKLLGRWSGKAGQIPFALQFERNAGGKYVVFIDDAKTDSTTYKGYMIIKASMNGANLSMKTPFFGPEISGKLSFFGNKIDGVVKVKESDSSPQYYTTPFSLTRESAWLRF